MPLPQVNDRLKEIPAHALRTVFATIGQILLVADRFRARATEQLSGSGEAPASRPADQAPAEAPPATPPAPRTASALEAENARWRSLDKTGNVRLLDGDDEQDAEDLAVSPAPSASDPSVSEFSFSEPVSHVPEAVPAPVEYTPTEPQPADPPVPDPADLAVSQPADPAVPDPADLAVPEPAEAAVPDAADSALPVPNYDQLTVASLRARLRVLDATQVQELLDYEKAHEGRPAVITMFERRLTKLSEGS